MSEYWVSRDKYYCKYCKIYIADDKPSRSQHETGLRHKGNYERYIRDIYKKGDRDRKDKAEEAQEIARIEAAAQLAMQAAGTPVASTSTSPSAPPKPRPAAAASSDPYANYTTAASLGIVDEEAERQAAEAELRQKEGRIGEWERVVRPKPPPSAAAPLPSSTTTAGEGEGDGESKPGTEDDPPERVKKGYFTEKSLAFDDDEFDPASVGIKLKRKRATLKEEEAQQTKEREEREREAREEQASQGVRGSWQEAEVKSEPMLEFDAPVKSDEDGGAAGAVAALPGAEATEEKPAVSKGGGFKKRKMLGAGAARKK
ncbi:hypothetical protein JCM1840_001141 [Sporobolomyces johnsonii]